MSKQDYEFYKQNRGFNSKQANHISGDNDGYYIQGQAKLFEQLQQHLLSYITIKNNIEKDIENLYNIGVRNFDSEYINEILLKDKQAYNLFMYYFNKIVK